ncbi:MAG: hypothetical protein ACK5MN_04585 [Lachnospiraceae bacterium]
MKKLFLLLTLLTFCFAIYGCSSDSAYKNEANNIAEIINSDSGSAYKFSGEMDEDPSKWKAYRFESGGSWDEGGYVLGISFSIDTGNLYSIQVSAKDISIAENQCDTIFEYLGISSTYEDVLNSASGEGLLISSNVVSEAGETYSVLRSLENGHILITRNDTTIESAESYSID